MLDYYEVQPDGSFVLLAQMRACHGGCSDPVESVTRRNVEAIILGGVSPQSLLRFCNSGIRVFEAKGLTAEEILRSYSSGRLNEIKMDRFAKLGKRR